MKVYYQPFDYGRCCFQAEQLEDNLFRCFGCNFTSPRTFYATPDNCDGWWQWCKTPVSEPPLCNQLLTKLILDRKASRKIDLSTMIKVDQLGAIQQVLEQMFKECSEPLIRAYFGHRWFNWRSWTSPDNLEELTKGGFLFTRVLPNFQKLADQWITGVWQ